VGGFEAVEHRRLERVVAGADVLEIDHEHVETVQLFGGRTQAFHGVAVEADHARAICPDSRFVLHRFQILRLAEPTVFRSENGHELQLRRREHQIHGVAKPPVHGRGMGHEAHPLAVQSPETFSRQDIQTRQHAVHDRDCVGSNLRRNRKPGPLRPLF
jgi:hypothetical protein